MAEELVFDKFDNIKKKFLEGLERYHGIISSACQYAGISRQTYYNYISEDQSFKSACDEVNESAIDFVEGKLFEKINGWENAVLSKEGYVAYDQPPSDTAIIFYLKTKAKKRGYVEKQEVGFTDKDGNDINPTPISFTKGSNG